MRSLRYRLTDDMQSQYRALHYGASRGKNQLAAGLCQDALRTSYIAVRGAWIGRGGKGRKWGESKMKENRRAWRDIVCS